MYVRVAGCWELWIGQSLNIQWIPTDDINIHPLNRGYTTSPGALEEITLDSIYKITNRRVPLPNTVSADEQFDAPRFKHVG
jgi:hypothetical protein